MEQLLFHGNRTAAIAKFDLTAGALPLYVMTFLKEYFGKTLDGAIFVAAGNAAQTGETTASNSRLYGGAGDGFQFVK